MLSLSATELQEDPAGQGLSATLRTLRDRVADIYLHVDIDVLAGEFAPGVDFPTPGGLTPAELEGALTRVSREFTVRAAALTAYDPDRERDDVTLHSGLRLMEVIAAAA
jgi:arginase